MKHLGYETDLFLLAKDGIITAHEDCISVITPDNPTYYFGNFLLLKSPPKNENKGEIEKRFEALVGINSVSHHKTFCWNPTQKTDISHFLEEGYEYEERQVLTAKADDLIAPKNQNTTILIRPFSSKEDWEQWIDLVVEERDEGHTADRFRVYAEGKAHSFQRLHKDGKGNFYGAFVGDELAGALGLFHQNKLGRFQEVLTKTAFRRQAICKTLVYTICKEAFESLDDLVIVATDGEQALKIYQSLGFKAKERQASLCFWKK